jgi:hypothetical protein
LIEISGSLGGSGQFRETFPIAVPVTESVRWAVNWSIKRQIGSGPKRSRSKM